MLLELFLTVSSAFHPPIRLRLASAPSHFASPSHTPILAAAAPSTSLCPLVTIIQSIILADMLCQQSISEIAQPPPRHLSGCYRDRAVSPITIALDGLLYAIYFSVPSMALPIAALPPRHTASPSLLPIYREYRTKLDFDDDTCTLF